MSWKWKGVGGKEDNDEDDATTYKTRKTETRAVRCERISRTPLRRFFEPDAELSSCNLREGCKRESMAFWRPSRKEGFSDDTTQQGATPCPIMQSRCGG